MGHKNVCFTCRKVQNLGTDYENQRKSDCPECSQPMALLPHRFRPPKRSEKSKWQVAQFLVNNGFPYQHIYDGGYLDTPVSYPENMRDAIIFVRKYDAQRLI